jgi:outer membrane beta-barrel protein
MESGIRVLLLTAAAALLALPCAAVSAAPPQRDDSSRTDGDAQQQDAPPSDDDSTPPRVVEPEVERRKVNVPGIHSSNIEIGAHYGALDIEDFGTNPAYGGIIAFHVTEDFFFRGDIGRSNAGKTSAETLSNIPLTVNRRFTYYDLSLGYNFLPGEAFIGRGTAMSSNFYVLAGIGATEFAGDKKFTVNFGAGYQVLPTDWLAINLEVQDRLFQSNILGYSKLTNNLEARIITSVYF